MGKGAERRSSAREEHGADALDHYWDDLVRPRGVHLGGLSDARLPNSTIVDPALEAAVRRLYAADDAPPPSAEFSVRLRRDLVGAGAAEPGSAAAASPRPEVVAPRSLGVVHARLGRRDVARAALAVAAAIGLALVEGRDLDRLLPGLHGATPTIAAEARTPPPTPVAAGCTPPATPDNLAGVLPGSGTPMVTATAKGGSGCA